MATGNSYQSQDNEITEEIVERNFKAFRQYLEQNIKTVELIAYYNLFTFEQRKRIRHLNKKNPTEAISEALDAVEESNEAGKYLQLLKALENAGYPKLVMVLKGLFVPVNDVHREKINAAAKHIYKLLKPSNILSYLLSKHVITSNDAETIQKVEWNESDGCAALDLLFILPNRSKHWYISFLASLVEDKHIELAELIDMETTEKIVEQLEGHQDISMASVALSLQPRALVEREITQADEDYGEPPSVNNLSAPNMESKFVDLSMRELVEEPVPGLEEYSVGENGEKIISAEKSPQRTHQGKMKDILTMHSLKALEFEETSLKTTATPKSPESNFSGTQPSFCEETFSKQVYERDPPDENEEKQKTYTFEQENKFQSLDKPMKDKDLSASTDENKIGNITANIIDTAHFSDSDEKEDVIDEDISLREYQKELAEPAIRGQNCLIVAPTGSGKTRVALKIIQEHLRKSRGCSVAKVIFLVNQVALANQQAEACEQHLKKYKTKVISGDTQRSKGECLKDFVDKRDIMVVTVQVLLDALVKKEISSITKFSLMIFDECHHTHANHPFNQIMSMYLDLKLDPNFDKSALPQIIGLTASVGVGKAKDVGQAVQHIKSLMANLDSSLICTVQSNMSELRRYVNVPDEETCTVPRRSSYVFGKGVTSTMERIEITMTTSTLVKNLDEAEKFEKILRAPAEKGSAQYTQWLSTLWKETAKLRNQEARRFLNPCRAHLEYYNNALIIYNDARVQDALNYLKENMKRWKESAMMNDNEKLLERFFLGALDLPFHQDSNNPKLEKLKEMILKGCPDEESRGIVFVKTRDLATAIVSWMKETPGLKELNAIKFVGQNMSADKGGMTKVQQDDALKYFRDGKHKIIVATSVAEEGLDISKCNLVIRYDHVTNEIAMVQSRGRGRAENSKYVVVAERGKGMAEKEELNMIREILMRKAIIQLQRQIVDSPNAFREELYKLQDEAKLDRDLRSAKRKGKRIRHGEFELRCLRCSEFICMSSDVKKIQNAHHVCLDESLKDRVDYIRRTPQYIDDENEAIGKLICTECGFDLGGILKHRGLEFPVMKIEKYLVVDMNGRQDSCKQWKKAPFVPQPLTTEDFRAILQKRKENGELE